MRSNPIRDYVGGKADLSAADALRELLGEALAMNRDLMALGKGRNESWPYAIGIAVEVDRLNTLAERMDRAIEARLRSLA